nr:hypothetical protein [Microbacterium sp.]
MEDIAEHVHLARQTAERVEITLQLISDEMVANNGDINPSALTDHELIDHKPIAVATADHCLMDG